MVRLQTIVLTDICPPRPSRSDYLKLQRLQGLPPTAAAPNPVSTAADNDIPLLGFAIGQLHDRYIVDQHAGLICRRVAEFLKHPLA